MKTFAECKPSVIIDWKEKFDEIYNDDGQLTLMSKETFEHTGDDIPDFKYRYIIKGTDMYAMGSDERSIAIELFMEVLPECICEKKLKEICESIGAIDVESLWAGEVVDYGYGIRFGNEYISYNENEEDDYYNLLDNKEVVETLNVCASVFEGIDSLRGFYLDSSWNMIGTTGWDTLRELLEDKDMIKATIERYNSEVKLW